MSRDIFVQDLPPGILSVEDIPDDFVPQALGVTRSQVVEAVRAVKPECDVSDPSWIILEELGEYHIEVNLGASERELCVSSARRPRGRAIDQAHT